MSDAFECDRCGAFGSGDPEAEFRHVAHGGLVHGLEGSSKTTVELCSDCAISLNEWYGEQGDRP